MIRLNKLETLKDLVQEAVDKGATTVEQVHLEIANLPFKKLEEMGTYEDEAKSAQKLQTRSISSIYDLIRTVNQKVGDFASDIFESIEDSQSVSKILDSKDDPVVNDKIDSD